ncbi:MAG TPA: bifunctional 3-(3-hydroxy-phenyl)propionate/3-hydroxycinnamic acid hydroxylase [Stellaceae bacterium]|nr:bifunctional 3-(3-hydroxy-phenyl)propionate/3-hydroxycinnamic acid hydroxylase [Stellaceae bacterium]
MDIIETSVLIIGGGPTGLTLANFLGQGGVDTVIVDRKPSTVAEPRGVSIDDESLRSMQSVGLVSQVLQNVVPGYGVHYFTRAHGRRFAKVEPTASEYGYPRRNAFRQPLFEATLKEGLGRFACVNALFYHEVEHFEQDGPEAKGGVEAEVTRIEDGHRFRIRARYLIACDGGRSPVREALGLRMVGSTFKSRWLVVDTDQDDDPFSQMRVYCDAARPVLDVPGPQGTRRYEVLIHPHESAEDALLPEQMAAWLDPVRGKRPMHLVRKTVYTFHARMAERWQVGRIFLAGDAAHLTPPYAGQGMNSGVRDAVNLGWKLVAVLRGKLPEAILASYEDERRDHAWALIRLALNLGIVMAPSSRLSAWAWQSFLTLSGYIPPLRDYFLQMKFKPKPRFAKGLLGLPDGAGKHSLRGRMLPQPLVTAADGGTQLLDDLIGPGFALIQYGGDDALPTLRHPLWRHLDARRIRILPAGSAMTASTGTVTVIDGADALKMPLAPHDGQILLLRPDRYVAGAFRVSDETRFAEAYTATLGTGVGQNRHPTTETRAPDIAAAERI